MVLVVDDAADMLMLCGLYLRAGGFEVLEASNGTEALALARAYRPAVIVLDFMLPDLDGDEVLRALQQDRATREIPVVMLTARANHHDERAMWERGIFDYVTKPFQPERLVEAVGGALLPGWRDEAGRRRREALQRFRPDDFEAGQWLAAIIEGSEDAIVSTTLEGRITSWNLAAERLFGYIADEVIGRPIAVVATPDRDEIAGLLARAGRGERIERHETVRRHRDGHPIEVSLSMSPIRDRSGTVIGAVTMVRDLTARNRALRSRQAFVEASPDAMVIVDEAGVIELVNHQTETLFGYNRADLVGQAVEKLIPARFRAAHHRHHKHYFAAPRVREMGAGLDLCGLRSDGSEFPVEISLNPLWTEERITVAAVIRDATERKETEAARTLALEQEREAARRLHELERLRSDLLSSVSHEVRTPLTAIQGFSHILTTDWNALPDNQKIDLIGRIERAARNLDSLMRDLLNFTRLESGLHAVTLEPQPLAPLVDGVLDHAAHLLQDHPIQVAVGDDLIAMADPDALSRVLENLLSNAAKFSPPGSSITLTAHPETTGIAISVADRGPGIPTDEQPRIFQRFYRAAGTTKRLPGTGIGLALVKELTEAQGGHVEMTSTEGAGSTFTIHLPGTSPPP